MALGINRPRKPTRLKVIDGDHDAAKRNPREPAGRFAIPKSPSHLDKWERAAWVKFSRVMERMRITTADDAAAFELLCSSWAEAQKLRDVLRREGVTYETLNSQGTRMVRARPELTALGDIDRRVLNLLARFGLTPADRSRVSDLAAPDPGTNPDDEFCS